jgi:ribosomal protein S18 acetylase RimI-like enzyme
MEQVVIKTLQAEDISQTAVVAARAFSTDPLTVAVYRERSDKESRMEATFRHLLEHKPGLVFTAKKDGVVVGMLRVAEWPNCQKSFNQALISLPIAFMRQRGAAIRRLRARYSWSKHHPKEPHWHLGPVAVLPELQGQGIGSQLIEHFCKYMDSIGGVAFLETETIDNVRLYERFGFSVTDEALLIGVRNWFMWRRQGYDVS